MIIVTGGAGMIGSNVIEKLNFNNYDDILVVDNLKKGEKFFNLSKLKFQDYQDKNDFYQNLEKFKKVKAVFHLGACSDTTNWDGQYMLQNNYECSKKLYIWCQKYKVPLIYASSAAVYGKGLKGFNESEKSEAPLNIYGYSKLLFDQYVRKNYHKSNTQVVGLRYFNVYGQNEQHKGSMASTIFHFNNQIKKYNVAKLFKGTDGILNGEQKRDFVYVKDCADLNFWFFQNRQFSGIFNVGTGNAETFNSVAKIIIKLQKKGKISYVDFPTNLKNSYQNFTKANLSSIRSLKCPIKFLSLEDGIKDYLSSLYS